MTTYPQIIHIVGKDQDSTDWERLGVAADLPHHEIWGMNHRPRSTDPLQIQHYDRWFHLHHIPWLETHDSSWWDDQGDWWRTQTDVPVYTFHEDVDCYAMGRTVPVSAMEFQQPRGDYHASSFDWMVAYALLTFSPHELEGQIVLHGVGSFWNGGEPLAARACLEYWCGVAAGQGVMVGVSHPSDLFTQAQIVVGNYRYGLDEPSEPVIGRKRFMDEWLMKVVD